MSPSKRPQTIQDCICLLKWPTSCALLLNYSGTLKCSSVWQHATRAPLSSAHERSHTDLQFMDERELKCVYIKTVHIKVCCQSPNAHMHACVITDLYTRSNDEFQLKDFSEERSKYYKNLIGFNSNNLVFSYIQMAKLNCHGSSVRVKTSIWSFNTGTWKLVIKPLCLSLSPIFFLQEQKS